jgi:hypothetical protein
MVRALVALFAVAYLMLSAGCTCDCTICCPDENDPTVQVCATSEDRPRWDCENADGLDGCTAKCN